MTCSAWWRRAGAGGRAGGERLSCPTGVRAFVSRESVRRSGCISPGHPIGQFESGLDRFVTHRIGDLISDRPIGDGAFGGGKASTVAGLIDEVKKRGPRTILHLDDRTGRVEVTLFEDVFQRYRDLVAKDALVLVEGSLRFDEFSDAWRLSAQDESPSSTRSGSSQARRVVLKLAARPATPVLMTDWPRFSRPASRGRARSRWNTRPPVPAAPSPSALSGPSAPAGSCWRNSRAWWAAAASR